MKQRVPRLVARVVIFSLMMAVTESFAQDGGLAASGNEVSLYVGSMLPNQIEGITEILPVFGGRYGIRTTSLGLAEIGIANTHAQGVDFSTLSVSLRADLPAVDQFMGMVYGGADLNYYRPVTSEERKTELGFHVGAGLMMHMASNLWLRSDLKFMATPGTSLSILFGFVFRPN